MTDTIEDAAGPGNLRPPARVRREGALERRERVRHAASDPEFFWAQQAEALDWAEKWDTVLDDSNPPFYKWFTGGKLNASYNCLDRHVEAGRGDRVAFHWRGEEGEQRDVTYADLHRDVQKLANALKDRGIGQGDVVGIFLPMIPEVVVAMLACARIGAPHNVVFGGFSPDSVKERMQFSERQGADHGRRRAPQGQDRAGEARASTPSWRRPVDRDVVVVKNTGGDVRHGLRARRLVPRGARGGRPGVPGGALRRREPAVRALHVGLDREAEGHPAHDGRLPDRCGDDPQLRLRPRPEEDVYWCSADVGWVTGHSYIVYGPLMNGATSVMYEGAPTTRTRASGGSCATATT